jgi:large subunit ribosomal protein L25
VHIDLLGLKKGEKLQIEVPVQFVGSAIGIKEGGVLQQVLHKLEIECLPTDIPDHLEIDITNLKLGKAIHISDLKFQNIEFLNSADSIIVTVAHPKVEKVATPAEGQEVTEPEVIAKGKQDKEEE